VTDRELLLMRLMELIPQACADSAELPEELRRAVAEDPQLRDEAAFMRRLCEALRAVESETAQQDPPEPVRQRTMAILQDPDELLCATLSSMWRRHRPIGDDTMLACARGGLDASQRREVAEWTGDGQVTCVDCAVRYEGAMESVQHYERVAMAAATHETRPGDEAVEIRCGSEWRVRIEHHALFEDGLVVTVYPPATAPAGLVPKVVVGLDGEAARRHDWGLGSRLFTLEPVLTPRGEALFAGMPSVSVSEVAFVGLSLSS